MYRVTRLDNIENDKVMSRVAVRENMSVKKLF